MLKITTLFVIFACLTTAFALNSTLTKNFFFVNTYNHLSYKLFHTTNGIIAYNLEYSPSGSIPQYILLDPVEGYAALILEDILVSCGHVGAGVFDRLQYNIQTSTLAYFCTANNSLLILDEKTYAVKGAVATGISASFSEVKLTSDGSYLYVLLMGALYSTNQVSSQLVQIDLSTRKILNTVVFDHGLEVDEYVNEFVSQNNEAYALTNSISNSTGATTVTIYSVGFIGNTYELAKVTNFTTRAYSGYISQLFQLGDFLVTNNEAELIFLNKQGNIAATYSTIYSKFFSVPNLVYVPAAITHEGSSDLYVLSSNQTLFKFTAHGEIITPEIIGTAYDFQIAYGNHYTSDLLFTIDTEQANFSITTLQNSDLIYSMPTSYNDFFIANSTFGVINLGHLQVFDRQSNALIGDVSLPTTFYLHKETDTLYFSQVANGYTGCIIKQLDLTTLSIVDVKEYSNYLLCTEVISEFKVSDTSSPAFVALSPLDNSFNIITEAHGIVSFNLAEFTTNVAYIVPDYETLSLYLLESYTFENFTGVSYYEYNGSEFHLKTSYNVEIGAPSSFYASGNQKVFAFSDDSFSFSIIDLEYGSTTEYSVPTQTKIVSSFQDHAGRKNLILSDVRNAQTWNGNVTQPSLFGLNGVSPVPGATTFTVQAGAAGPCSYWVVDGFITSVGFIKFYDACTAEDTSASKANMFSILQ